MIFVFSFLKIDNPASDGILICNLELVITSYYTFLLSYFAPHYWHNYLFYKRDWKPVKPTHPVIYKKRSYETPPFSISPKNESWTNSIANNAVGDFQQKYMKPLWISILFKYLVHIHFNYHYLWDVRLTAYTNIVMFLLHSVKWITFSYFIHEK